MSERVLLVTGASGHLGREVVERLVARGGDRIVAGSRDPAKLAALTARGVEVRRVDFDDEASLATAFVGVDRALIVSGDGLAPGQRAAQHRRAIDAAARAGVGHLVYTSFTNPTPDSAISVAADHHATEAALARSGVGYTALRNNVYVDLQVPDLRNAIATGELVTARGDGAVAMVTRSDCARAAAAALADDFEGARTVEVTGPDALTGDDLAAILSELGGRPVVHVAVSPDTWVQDAVSAGLPAPLAAFIVSFDVGIARGELATVGDGVQALTGAPATPIRAFLASALA